MFPALTSGSAGSTWDRLSKRARLEWVDPARRSANMVKRERGGGVHAGRRRRRWCVWAAPRPPFTHSRSTHTHTSPQSLLRAVGLFVGGVIVARNFGDAFNV